MTKEQLTFTIRNFRIQDYKPVLKLWQRVELPVKPRGRDRLQHSKKEIKLPNNLCLVAEIKSGVIGSIVGTHDGRKGWINRLAVHPDYQQRGLAAALVKEVEKKLEKLGIDIIACLIEDHNRSSMQFFEKIGYHKHRDITYFSKRKYPYT